MIRRFRGLDRLRPRLAFALASLMLVGALGSPVPARARPNVVIVSLDTVRADTVRVMPALQGLATRGIEFNNALSAAPWTVPSHAALFTGRDPLKLSCEGMKLDIIKDVPSLMTMLDAVGYEVSVMTELGVLTEDEGYGAGTTHFWTGGPRSAIPAVKQWRRRNPREPWFLDNPSPRRHRDGSFTVCGAASPPRNGRRASRGRLVSLASSPRTATWSVRARGRQVCGTFRRTAP